MATLTSGYQYLGRSSVMKSQNNNLSYYLLLYGKTYADQTTGIHTVTIKSVLASTISTATFYQYGTTFNGTINGSTVFSGKNKPSKAWELGSFSAGGVNYKEGTLIGEGSIDVDCTDGLSKDITLSAYWKFTVSGAAYTPAKNTERTVSVTVTLSAIPRQATLLTAPDFSDTNNPTITYSNPAGESVASLQAGIYDSTGYIPYVPYKDISKTGTSYTFSLTSAEKEALMGAIQEGNSVPVKFYLKTTIGSNTYLSTPIERTFSVNDAAPIVSASVRDTNETTIALTGDSSKLIKYYSNAYVEMYAEPQKGAVIDESLYIIRNGDSTGYGSTHTFEKVENNVFTCSAEDNRGNVGSYTVAPTMVDYVKPTCNISNNRPDALGNMTVSCTGDYFNGSFGAVVNTLKVQYRYKADDGAFGGWEDMTVTKNGNRYYASADFDIPDFNQASYYTFEAKAIDSLDTVTSTESSVKSIPMFHWSENDFVFEVPVTFNAGASGATEKGDQTIDGDLNVTGNVRLKGGGNYGNVLLFGDGTYCYIAENEDDVMTIKAKKINLLANGVYVDGYPIPILDKGTWAPTLNSSAVSSYTTQYGWYMKMNQTVTIGFYIKANCRSGYTSSVISISGLPYTPLFSAAGGGMCSGAYIYDTLSFQCFVAETSGNITTRVQHIGNTSASNISTSASGLFYPSGGGELTLSGTITYMADS